jgi:CDP-diacylglycerol---serine O-phosphatidyltransferase
VARVWRRRRSIDTPRPAGRRWARLRRSGSRATQVLARVARGRRRNVPSSVTGEQIIFPERSRTRSRRTVSVLDPTVGRDRTATEASVPVPIPLLPGERTPARRLKFAVVNGFTVASLMLGMVAIFLAIDGDLKLAAVALLGCVVCDGLDGGLARRFSVASPFGAQMDSMADLASFGVATAVVLYQWLVAQGASPVAAAPACASIAVCAAIRLARFNVSPKNGRYFCGVPTTMTAAVLALHVLVGPELPAPVSVVAVTALAVAMVTSFPYAKLARLIRLPLWLWVFPAICAMISVPGTFAAVVAAYVLSGPLVWVLHRRRPTAPATPIVAG